MSYTATTEEILRLRRMTGEPSGNSDYSDYELAELIESVEGDFHAAAAEVWQWKAAAVAGLFDWAADGGDYKQSVLYDRYMANAAAEKAQSPRFCGMVIDPTLKPVNE